MRKITGLVLAAALMVPAAAARAAEVTHFKADGRFASTISTDPGTGMVTGVFVSKEDGKGAAVYRVFYSVSTAGGDLVALGSGLLPKHAFHMNAHSASLDVDIHEVTLDTQIGAIPANGVISIDWDETDTVRNSGNIGFEFPGGRVMFTGTVVNMVANAEGEAFGTAMADPVASMTILHQNTIIIMKD